MKKFSYRTQANADAIAKLFNKPLDKPDWFKIEAKDNGDDAEILVYDAIGWPYNDPRDLIMALANMENVTIRIHSPGGDAWDSLAIYNAMQSHKGKVTTRNEGVAASAASVILMGGKPVQAYDNTMTMIHNAWLFMAGNQYELREAADFLEKVDSSMMDVYQKKCKKSKRDIMEMMKSTTYMSAKEALDGGFIDEIVTGKSVAKSSFDLSIFGEVPEELRNMQTYEATVRAIRDIEHSLRDAGVSKAEAKSILARCRNLFAGGNPGDDVVVPEVVDDSIKALCNRLILTIRQ